MNKTELRLVPYSLFNPLDHTDLIDFTGAILTDLVDRFLDFDRGLIIVPSKEQRNTIHSVTPRLPCLTVQELYEGATLPVVDDVYVLDECIKSQENNLGQVAQWRERLDDNTLLHVLEKAGSARVTLITPADAPNPRPLGREWQSKHADGPIRARGTETPLHEPSPLTAELNAAVEGRKTTGDLHARRLLQDLAVLDGDGSPTSLGERIHAHRLPTLQAHAVLTAPSNDLERALTAAFIYGRNGTLNLVETPPGRETMRQKREDPEWSHWPTSIPGNAVLSLATAMASAARGTTWLKDTNLRREPLHAALREYEATTGEPATSLTGIDYASLHEDTWNHLHAHPLYSPYTLRRGKSTQDGVKHFDAVYTDAWGLQDVVRGVPVIAIPREEPDGKDGVRTMLEYGVVDPAVRMGIISTDMASGRQEESPTSQKRDSSS